MTYKPHTTGNEDGTITHGFFDTITGTWTFVVVDEATKEAAIIDSVLGYDLATGAIDTKLADALLAWLHQEKIKPTIILETHVHADHLTAANYLKVKLGGNVPVAIGEHIKTVQKVVKQKYDLPAEFLTDGSQFDTLLADGATFKVGNTSARVIHTPGHTPDSNTFLIGHNAYVGDVVFLPDVGSARCDFPGGSAHDLFKSITVKLLALPDHTKIFIGHDYPPGEDRAHPHPFATVANQRSSNKHVKDGVSESEFTTWRKERDAQLGQPRLLHASLQLNATAGRLPPKDAEGRSFFRTPVSGAAWGLLAQTSKLTQQQLLSSSSPFRTLNTISPWDLSFSSFHSAAKASSAKTPPTSAPDTLILDNGDATETHCFFDHITESWCYIVVDQASREAVIVDPILGYNPINGKIDTIFADALLDWIETAKIKVKMLLETHVHADHITAAHYLKGRLNVPVAIGSKIPDVQKTVKYLYNLPETFPTNGDPFDITISDNDVFHIGKTTIKALATPGHTPDSTSFLIGKQIYVGDVIFLPDVGTARCDFPGGSVDILLNSITRILGMPADTRIYVGHDYPPPDRQKPSPYATVEEQRLKSKHFKKGDSEDEFKAWRAARDKVLGQPRLLHASLQVNAKAGKLPEAEGALGRKFVKVPFAGKPHF
ncbi:hypothetical protein HDU97_000014 [Phlyctochytrium planicorne]|nr:hypothetical protein HDU97_000014 [Phlyctochytrium planicorne]